MKLTTGFFGREQALIDLFRGDVHRLGGSG